MQNVILHLEDGNGFGSALAKSLIVRFRRKTRKVFFPSNFVHKN